MSETLNDWTVHYASTLDESGTGRRMIYTHVPSDFSLTMTYEEFALSGGRIGLEDAIGKALDLGALTWSESGFAEEPVWVSLTAAGQSWSTAGTVQGMEVATTGEFFVMGLHGDDGPDHFTDLLVMVIESDQATLSIGTGSVGETAAATYDMQTRDIRDLAGMVRSLEPALAEKLAEIGATCS